MTSMTATSEKRDILIVGSQHGGDTGHSDAHPPEVDQQGEGENAEALNSDEKESSSDQESEEDDHTSLREKTDILRVSIYCEMDRHRSVAMAEGMAKIPWPGWRVEVEHKDIPKKRGAGKKSGGKCSRGIRGRTMPMQYDVSSD